MPELRLALRLSRTFSAVKSALAFALHALLAGDLTFAESLELGAADLDRTVALVVSDQDARARYARSCQRVSVRRRAVGKELFAAAQHDGDGEDGHRVDEVVGQERMDEFGAPLELRSIHERVRSMQGHVNVDSRPGEGTKILVRIPIGAARNKLVSGSGSDRAST